MAINIGALTKEVRKQMTETDTTPDKFSSHKKLIREEFSEKRSRIYISPSHKIKLDLLSYSDEYKGQNRTEIANRILAAFFAGHSDVIEEVKQKLSSIEV